MELKLFAVYLGGRAPGCNTELHDVVFVVGSSIEETYPRLLRLWFGSPEGLHIDSWIALETVAGYRVTLTRDQIPDAAATKKLFFVNLGAYLPGQFTELHANAFIVAEDEREVKQRAKGELLTGMKSVHTDDLFDLDDCLRIDLVDGMHVSLQYTGEESVLNPNNGYHIIPKQLVRDFVDSKTNRSPETAQA